MRGQPGKAAVPYHCCRCPDTAQISEFYDDQGVYHRIIDHAPLPNVTSAMMKWWFSPALAVGNPFVKFRGETVYWYKLWHPLDHKALLPAALPAPSFPLIDAPVFVADGRFGIQLRGPGGVVDSPEGLRLRTELIIGIGNRGPAQRLNQFTLQVVRDQFPGLSDQVTRHHIEEVGNFADFLPELFAQYGPGSRMRKLGPGAAAPYLCG
ncbi:DAPG_hydrolase domain-containing protein [Haematococcus lacustris]|uniref:DAPG_hydrolase domain-containing protein n=1 Tax=Haematococcus lacustris TaxID=44745 RepID=A0A699YV55_HAELA|nr:DAPG_hydrolase domain-containing protein [Haematococcus lacustris]